MNENLKMFLQKVAADEKIQAKMKSFDDIDEAYDYAVSIQDGYSKEEFEAVMAKSAKGSTINDEISDTDLESVAGGTITEGARGFRASAGDEVDYSLFAATAI